MSADDKPSFEAMLQNLRNVYLQSLPEKWSRLEQLAAASNVAELKNEFHKLKGSGTTYGVPEISEMGAALEQLCLATLHSKHDEPSLLRSVRLAVETLKKIHASKT
jgi:HPt (histidine-containing phosphotransfer) domain-containing protein